MQTPPRSELLVAVEQNVHLELLMCNNNFAREYSSFAYKKHKRACAGNLFPAS